MAALVTLAANGRVQRARIVAGGIGIAPMRLEAAEGVLAGHAWSERGVAEAAVAARGCPADGDDIYPADYRQHLAGVLTERALTKAHARSEQAHG